MKALLLCKGPGATILAKEDLNKYDFIAWANWNNYRDKTINIPTRVDKLYLYDYTYITEIPLKKLNQFKKHLKVKSVKILNSHKRPSEEKRKKWLDALCKCWDREYENFEAEVNYEVGGSPTKIQSYWPVKKHDQTGPSTGHAALTDLTINHNFDEIHVAGMDLFSGRQYYFDARETVVSDGGRQKLKYMIRRDPNQISTGLLKNMHPEDSAMENIIKLLKDYPHIEYTFYSINKNYKKQFKKHDVKNGKVITK